RSHFLRGGLRSRPPTGLHGLVADRPEQAHLSDGQGLHEPDPDHARPLLGDPLRDGSRSRPVPGGLRPDHVLAGDHVQAVLRDHRRRQARATGSRQGHRVEAPQGGAGLGPPRGPPQLRRLRPLHLRAQHAGIGGDRFRRRRWHRPSHRGPAGLLPVCPLHGDRDPDRDHRLRAGADHRLAAKEARVTVVTDQPVLLRPKEPVGPKLFRLGITLAILLPAIWGALGVEMSWEKLASAPADIWNLLRLMVPPDMTPEVVQRAMPKVMESLFVAWIATMIAAAISLLLAVLGARNISNRYVSGVIQNLFVAIRAFPE